MELKDIELQFKDGYLVYNRRSTDDAENQRNSLVYQRQRNTDYANHSKPALQIANLTIPGFCKNGIIDESHSAFKQEEELVLAADGTIQYRILRPKFLTLISLLQAHKIKGVIFLCWDRASRNEQDDLIIKKLMQMGCDIRFVETTYEKTSAGKLHMRVDGMFSSHYSEVISEKVKNAQIKLRGERRCLHFSPIGYLDFGSDNKPLDSERAPIVKRIFEKYATGKWSFRQLGKWAKDQGLTTKPVRRKRTKEEIADNLDLKTLSKRSRPVDHKAIEYMLSNPFYIAKLKIGDGYEDSKAHKALIDDSIFFKVQEILKKRRVSVYYVNKQFHTYREMARCTCERAYSPYEQKGIIYYRSRCKDGCGNTNPNLNESDISDAVQGILDQVVFTDAEVAEIEKESQKELAKINNDRNKTIWDLQAKQKTILADIDYITQNKITLLRTGSMDGDALKQEEKRLESKLAVVTEEMKAYAQSAPEMLKYITAFSEIVKDAGRYFKYALDSEKREITALIFTELIFSNRKLVRYEAKDGFRALLERKKIEENKDDPSDAQKKPQKVVSPSAGRIRTYDPFLTLYSRVSTRRGLYLCLPPIWGGLGISVSSLYGAPPQLL